MKRIVTGILAHVDSGKTTLSEGLLYCSGEIKKLGRVDHKNAFLDTHHIEQERGITIFSKQAVMHLKDCEITLLDTPGHVDFSAETERTLQVLDYAILVVSGSEGIQSHTETLWDLLLKYDIPVFVFVNKTDLAGFDRKKIISELKMNFSDGCVDFSRDKNEEFYEEIAVCNDKMTDAFLSDGGIEEQDIKDAILNREVFPCFFGSALKTDGITEFLNDFVRYTENVYNKDEFGARVFKIGEDEKGTRLTYMKVTGGTLKIKKVLEYNGISEKVNRIRIYSGAKFQNKEEAAAGEVCAVEGLSKTVPGIGFGMEKNFNEAFVEPVLSYKAELAEGTDMHSALAKFRCLEEEEPQYHVVWNEKLQEIHIRVMGEVQLEVLKQLLKERFSLSAEFSEGNILYKETIKSPVEGVGHYEPLKHYAEVHLLMEPTERGSGLSFETDCGEDELDKNWQRLILTHLTEKAHIGVLTGSPITDMRITLIAGKAHLKHTEGGDFRQATYRALRQGLKMAESVLLEPWYDFKIQLPYENVGRVMTDINNMSGEFSQPENYGEYSVITGSAPVFEMRNYYSELTAYTHGKGKLTCSLGGYRPCHNRDWVIEQTGYDSDADTENTADSVFCSHGAGFLVKWDKVRDYMHINTDVLRKKENGGETKREYEKGYADEKELMRIFEKTYGPVKHERGKAAVKRKIEAKPKVKFKAKPLPKGPEYLLVDGYNIIFAWEELKKLAKENLELARHRLTEILCEYKSVAGCELILVFDAYKVKNNPGTVEKIGNINVVYTKEAETADMYIEKVTHQLGKNHKVRVATSDGVEQLIILAGGALRISAENFQREVREAKEEIIKYTKMKKN